MISTAAQDDGMNVSRRAHSRTPERALPSDVQADVLAGTVSTLRKHRAGWVQLAERSGAHPSLHPDTQLAYLESEVPDADIVMVTVTRGGEMIGALPLIRDRALLMHIPIRRFRPPGPMDSPDRYDVLCAEVDSEIVTQAIWIALAARDDWDVLELVDLAEGGPGWSLFDLARSGGFGTGHRISRMTPFIPLNPALTLEENLPRANTKFRADMRRCRRNLEQRGPVALTRSSTLDPVLMTQFLEMEHAGWKGRNGTSILSDPIATAYHWRLARVAAENRTLAMYSLECAGTPIAMHFGLEAGGRYSVPKLTFDENYRSFAPGQLIVWDVLQDCLARGVIEFDFLGDSQPWKEKWTDQRRIHHRAHIFNRTLNGRLARTARYDIAPRGKVVARRLSQLVPGLSLSGPHAQELSRT